MDRQCSRPGCAEPAAATLTYHYDKGMVWLDTLVPERDPHAYDLCDRHADRLGVPRGWRFDDRRAVLVAVEPERAPLPAPVPGALVAAVPQRLAG